MNNFYTDNFNISKIILCVLVKNGAGQHIHKNRLSHGIVLQLNGIKNYIFADGKEMQVIPGSVFYLPKFSSYEVVDIEPGDCIAVNFDLSLPRLTYPFFTLNSDLKKYQPHFEHLLKHWDSKKEGNLNHCLMHLYSIICNIQQDKSALYVPSHHKNLIDTATEYIAFNLSDPKLTIDSISAHFGISPEYFRRLFRMVHQQSPRKYIMNMRMNRAKALLLSDEFTVSAIGQMCGYDSESYFSAEFKRLCGCTPSEYKQL